MDWSKWRRLQRGSSDKLETPQGIARGGSRSPRGKRSHLRKVTAVFNPNLKLCAFSVASFISQEGNFLNLVTSVPAFYSVLFKKDFFYYCREEDVR